MGLCINCKYIMLYESRVDLSKCSNPRFTEIHQVDGTPKYSFCDNIRKFDCTSGACFREKPVVPPKVGFFEKLLKRFL